jgi:uncharacterized protein
MSTAQQHLVTSQDEITELYGAPDEAVKVKAIPQLDEHCRAFIALSPFVTVATVGEDGACDASPRGGVPGFCDVTGPGTLVLPDEPGNRRLDTVRNIVATGRIGLLFTIPGMRETLRVNGRATISREPELLERYRNGRKPPIAAIVVETDEAYLHCAKAFIRSKLWEPSTWPERDGLASPARIWRDHIALADMTVEDIQAYVDDDYANNLRWGDR